MLADADLVLVSAHHPRYIPAGPAWYNTYTVCDTSLVAVQASLLAVRSCLAVTDNLWFVTALCYHPALQVKPACVEREDQQFCSHGACTAASGNPSKPQIAAAWPPQTAKHHSGHPDAAKLYHSAPNTLQSRTFRCNDKHDSTASQSHRRAESARLEAAAVGMAGCSGFNTWQWTFGGARSCATMHSGPDGSRY